MSAALWMAAPPAVYRTRRAALARQLTRPLLVCAGHAPARNYAANTYPFRPGSTYRYFGGPAREHAALLIEPGSDGDAGCTLFRAPSTVADAIWEGPGLPDDALAAAVGLSLNRLYNLESLAAAVAGRSVAAILTQGPRTIAQAQSLGLAAPSADEFRALVELRLHKDEHELAAMRRAATVTADAIRAALAAARPGAREADVAAVFAGALVARNCTESFTPIITIRGETFHATVGDHELVPGALLLIDAGAEEPTGYASDATRVAPVGGSWTPIQRDLYEVVLRAHQSALHAAVAGRRYRELHELAALEICRGLADVGLLCGRAEDLHARRAHTLFFPHGLGHLIGLEAHDMEDYGDIAGYAPGRTRPTEFGTCYLRMDRDLAPGMCVTIEPGIYLNPALWRSAELVEPLADVVRRDRVESLLAEQFGGIRIEHTIHIRAEGGPEVLTAALPTGADAIAALVPPV